MNEERDRTNQDCLSRFYTLDGLVYEVVRMAKKYGGEVPAYERAAEKFREMEVK